MSLKDFPYFCQQCKKIIDDVQQLLFVEEGSSRGFCSEACIEDFYGSLIHYYDEKINEAKLKFNLINESIEIEIEDNHLVDEISKSPDEIYKLTSELKEEIFFYIKKRNNVWLGLICTQFNQEPSFIFAIVKTKSNELINELRIGERLELDEKNLANDVQVDEDLSFLEELENKKSNMLAELIATREETDIPFEEFILYDQFLEDTLSSPDEVYETKDKFGDINFYYLKSFLDQKLGAFFYIVVGVKRNVENNEENFYPILTMPTNDLKTYNSFRTGKKIFNSYKN